MTLLAAETGALRPWGGAGALGGWLGREAAPLKFMGCEDVGAAVGAATGAEECGSAGPFLPGST